MTTPTKKTTAALQQMKRAGEPIVVLTCYDYPSALWMEEAGVDVIFCADSVGTNVLGYDDERQVTMDDMIHHLKAVRRGTGDAYLLADLPFGSCETPDQALGNSLRFASLGADGIKLEGHKPQVVEKLRARGLDVWGHLGLNPQLHERKGLKGRTARGAARLLSRARELEAAGASFLVLELIPEEVGKAISETLSIPTIGIAAGRWTDGQVLVSTDMLGVHHFPLRHVKRFADMRSAGLSGVRGFADAVRQRDFPEAEHGRDFQAPEQAELFRAWVESGATEPLPE
ncbi:MAG: 3-methyl-2-oxobutanoate hydroxymethyltransferase [Gemmatimonadetes bacterium]|jgi:3-methyl-2-oxobutanoate hydroxymethyltransferase|nr:3-methyl-2-oxobutanoate hydroxymethyltransferase [Gemmatimonadota bacterium]MBT6149701.1 3-methyl-2-oxobutanoate hydroxymethyltransferase [Gemmatimonadota bacterium]MBT7864581.1 3-methyl-2-oxobutanoate hydroxymethyltransferase [Gemmatimonadota bacterium]